MILANDWKDYSVIATGDGYKMERWKDVILLRPDPQVIWKSQTNIFERPVHARYLRSDKGGGKWEYFKKIPDEWVVSYKNLNFKVKPMGFKHTGLFPEQAANWDKMSNLIKGANRPISALNLFAYTGGATCALLDAGASVCHVDASRGMVERAGENVRLSNLGDRPVRFIIDDCVKFVKREIRRGKKYDAIIMDPPSNGEMWKIEDQLFDFVKLCAQVMSDDPLFFLINSYTTGLQPMVLDNILTLAVKGGRGRVEAYEVGLPTEEGIKLPCGAGGMFING